MTFDEPVFKETFREKHGFSLAAGAIFACFLGLLYVWVPSAAEKDSFRSYKVNPPPLGHWIATAPEMQAVFKEFSEIQRRVDKTRPGEYTPQAHLADVSRITDLTKSLLPIDGGYMVYKGMIPARDPVHDQAASMEAAAAYRAVQGQMFFVNNEISNAFGRYSTDEQKQQFRDLAEAANMFQRESKPVVETHWFPGPLFRWILKTHLQSMIVVFFFFLIRAEIIGQRRRILIYDAPKTAFWMLFWFVGIWKYPSDEAVVLVRLVQKRLAMAMSVFFTLAVPSFAAAQSGKADSKKKDEAHTLVLPKNSFGLGIEGVNKYHGGLIGEMSSQEPAPRVLGRYTRSTAKGNFYVDSWNSFGRAFNNEADLGVGFERHGLDVSYTHYALRGGDAEQLYVGKSGSMKMGKRTVPLSVSVFSFFRSRPSSPPGGILVRTGTGFSHQVRGLGLNLQLRHRVAASVDNNPFGLGKGWSALGFYTLEVGYKRLYAAWNTSVPIAGQDNTTRGFRQNFAGGYRQNFAW